MTKKLDRNKNAFYWEYDCYEDGAKAIRTWGDGGVLSLWMEYHKEAGYNAVRTAPNSKPTEYHYNDKMLCTRIVYPDLKSKKILLPSSGDNHAAFAFALLGAKVTSADISERQLENATVIAEKLNLHIDFVCDNTMELSHIENDI